MSLSSGYVEASFGKSWGVSPGGGSALLPGDASGDYEPGDEIVLNLGGATFHGMVTGVSPSAQGAQGTFTRLEIADNRIHLQMDITKCAWNITEVRADDPSTPGIDRQRRYWSIPPVNHPAQEKLWFDVPFQAADIIADILDDPDVDFAWEVEDPDGLLDAPVYEIDANNGAKLGAVLSEICSQLGILFTVTGYNTLLFARKGDGDVPYIAPGEQAAWSRGSALSHADTKIQVVGGRNLYQDNEVTLEPWWVPAWEVWSKSEGDWLAIVETLWGADWSGDTDEVQALKRSIKSRQVTVREFVAKYKTHSGIDVSDHGMWGEVCRMEMPAWRYLRDIVWKAFRVPRDYTLAFASLDETQHLGVQSLTFHEHLLGAVDYDADGNMSLKVTDTAPFREWYPPDAAFVIAKGFRVNVLDPRLVKCLTPEMLAAAREVWAPQNGFTLDARPESLGVIFDEAVVVDTAENPFFTFPNRGKDGIGAGHPLYNLCVPNADCAAAAPQVKMAIAWQANKYLKTFGAGARKGLAQSDGIAGHYIVQDGVVVEEVPWPDDDLVDDKAEAFAATLIGQQVHFDMGMITRVGGAGTELSGVVDRVEVRVERLSEGRGGLVEEVTLTKERVPVGYFNSRLLDRFARFHDLFAGQRANRVEIQTKEAQLRLRRLKTVQPPAAQQHKDLPSLMAHPPGAPQCGQKLLDVGEDECDAGQPVWLDDETEAEDDSGAVLGGIVVADKVSGMSSVATQGTVPVRVKGPFEAGDSVGVDDDHDYAEVDGERIVGNVQATYTGSDTLLAPVQLGAGGGAAEKYPFQGYKSKYTGGGSPPEDQAFRYRMRIGKGNHFTPSNIDAEFTAPTGVSYAWLKATIASGTGRPSALEIETGSSVTATPAPGSVGVPPAVTYRGIVKITANGSGITKIEPLIKDSQWISTILSGVDADTGNFRLDTIWTSATDGTSLGIGP